MNQDLTSYYNDRAKEYDKVYQILEEQDDLRIASNIFHTFFAGKSVLEIACGTGYWTEQISHVAKSVWATDINESVLDIAKAREYKCPVTLQVADMNNLATDQLFDALFGGFIWSHILLQDLDGLLDNLKERLVPHSHIAFIDSKLVPGSFHNPKRITRTDEMGNTFQTRHLENGTTFEVLKNFPTRRFLLDKLSRIATDIEIIDLDYYWIVTSKLRPQ